MFEYAVLMRMKGWRGWCVTIVAAWTGACIVTLQELPHNFPLPQSPRSGSSRTNFAKNKAERTTLQGEWAGHAPHPKEQTKGRLCQTFFLGPILVWACALCFEQPSAPSPHIGTCIVKSKSLCRVGAAWQGLQVAYWACVRKVRA
jgi:hypothetical protein